MPIPFHPSASAKTPAQLRKDRIEREIENKRAFEKIEKRKIAQMKKSRLENTPINRTQVNKPDLRKNARQSMRFDKEISTHAYSVEENGRYWCEDVQMTLAVIAHARMIVASRQKRIHNYGDDNERREK